MIFGFYQPIAIGGH